MGGQPEVVKPPLISPPVAIPEVGDEVGEQARRRRPQGRRKTFLTGDLTPEFTGKKALLG